MSKTKNDPKEACAKVDELEGIRLMKENAQLKLEVQRLKIELDEQSRFYGVRK